MHPLRARKVLSDEETLNVAEHAEAVQQDAKTRAKKDKPRDPANSVKAHYEWLGRQQAKEAWRQKLKDAWNKHKKQ